MVSSHIRNIVAIAVFGCVFFGAVNHSASRERETVSASPIEIHRQKPPSVGKGLRSVSASKKGHLDATLKKEIKTAAPRIVVATERTVAHDRSLPYLPPGGQFKPAVMLDIMGRSGPQHTHQRTPEPVEHRKFCEALRTSVDAGRSNMDRSYLADLERRLEERTYILQQRIDELNRLNAEARAVKKRADLAITGIYEKMKPEASAAQIASMSDSAAAAILLKLGARQASSVLNEMPAARAARIAEAIADAVE